MKYLFLVMMFISTFFVGELQARGGGGGGHGMEGGGRGMEGGFGREAGVGGVGVGAHPNVNRGDVRAYDRGLEAGAVEGGGGYYGGYGGEYGWDNDQNAFPNGDQTSMDNGEQIYNEDETGYKGPQGGNPNNQE